LRIAKGIIPFAEGFGGEEPPTFLAFAYNMGGFTVFLQESRGSAQKGIVFWDENGYTMTMRLALVQDEC
jgi:hypothetical protein